MTTLREGLQLIRSLSGRGIEAYIAGGAVRDLMLGKEPSDVDVAVAARLDALDIRGAVKIGKNVPVLIVPLRSGEAIEIVSFDPPIEAELMRRDFTVNAMGMDRDCRIIEAPGVPSLQDLAERKLRYTFSAKARLNEDPLRALRYWRMLAVLPGFLPADDYGALHRDAARHTAVCASERIGKEVFKALDGEFGVFVRGLCRDGLLGAVIPAEGLSRTPQPERYHPEGDVLTHTLNSVEKACRFGSSRAARLAALLHDTGKPAALADGGSFRGHEKLSAQYAEAALRSWAWPADEASRVVSLVEHHMVPHCPMTPSSAARFARRFGGEWLDDLFALGLADCECQELTSVWSENRRIASETSARIAAERDRPRLVTGDEVMEILGVEEGPPVGNALEKLERAVDGGTVKDRSDAVRFLEELRDACGAERDV